MSDMDEDGHQTAINILQLTKLRSPSHNTRTAPVA